MPNHQLANEVLAKLGDCLPIFPPAAVPLGEAANCSQPVENVEVRAELSTLDRSIEATDFGLYGRPRSLTWPCAASSAEIARRLISTEGGVANGARFAKLES